MGEERGGRKKLYLFKQRLGIRLNGCQGTLVLWHVQNTRVCYAVLCCAVPSGREVAGWKWQAGWLAISHYLYISGEKA